MLRAHVYIIASKCRGYNGNSKENLIHYDGNDLIIEEHAQELITFLYAENHSYFESCCIRQRDITQIISETVFEWILPEDYVCADSDSPEHSINVTDYESDVVSPGHTALKDKVILAIESPD